MKRFIIILAMFLFAFIGAQYWLESYFYQTKPVDELTERPDSKLDSTSLDIEERTGGQQETLSTHNSAETIEAPDYIGMQLEELLERKGEPERSDWTPYGYVWKVFYEEEQPSYFGVADEEIVSVIKIGDNNVDWQNAQVGDDYETLAEDHGFNEKVDIGGLFDGFSFELTAADLKMKPLVQLDDDIFAQFYFDVHEKELEAVRFTAGEPLLKKRPYALSYRGALPEKDELNGANEDNWARGQEKQIAEITNLIREQRDLTALKTDERVSDTARSHSEEMAAKAYFAHDSPVEGSLADRLNRDGISYRSAAENIAARYVDGLEATIGWLNSEGHRVNLLNEEFSHIGVGVYQRHYTQNFLIE